MGKQLILCGRAGLACRFWTLCKFPAGRQVLGPRSLAAADAAEAATVSQDSLNGQLQQAAEALTSMLLGWRSWATAAQRGPGTAALRTECRQPSWQLGRSTLQAQGCLGHCWWLWRGHAAQPSGGRHFWLPDMADLALSCLPLSNGTAGRTCPFLPGRYAGAPLEYAHNHSCSPEWDLPL